MIIDSIWSFLAIKSYLVFLFSDAFLLGYGDYLGDSSL